MLGHQHLLVVLACVTFAVPTLALVKDGHTPEFADEIAVNYRLPNNTWPVSYEVNLTTNIHTQTEFTFTGEVAIRFKVLTASRTITLHQRQLTILSSDLVLASNLNQPIALLPFEYNQVNEFLTFTLANGDLIVNNEYILSIRYNGTLRSDEAGFYRSSYLATDGSRRYFSLCMYCDTG